MFTLLRRLVWNDTDRRLRAPFRLLVGVVVLLFAFVGTALLIRALRPFVPSFLTSDALLPGVLTLVTGTASLVALWLVGRFVDRRRFTDFGLHFDRDWWLDLAFGLFLGAALMSLVFAVEAALGWVVVTGTLHPQESFVSAFGGVVLLFLVVGVQEELLARGYLLTNLAEGLREYFGRRGATAVAVAFSSAVFGLLHANNPSATVVSTVAISAAGVMLALGYVLTDDLAIPIGLHITWNLFQGGVYGFPVSGLGIDVAVVSISQRGPDLWTGGSFGPEAGLLGIAAIVLGTLATVAYVRLRYQFLATHPDLTTPDLRWRDR